MTGNCVLRRVGGLLEVVEADDHIEISTEIVAQIELDFATAGCQIEDGVLTIRGINRTVRYRIDDYLGRKYSATRI